MPVTNAQEHYLAIENPDDSSSIKTVFKRLSSLALPMAASYTFSIEMWLLVFFLSRLNSDESHAAAITPITVMINALFIIGISPLFAMSMIAGKKYGALKKAQLENVNETDQQTAKDDIARVNHHGLMIATVMTPIVVLPLIFSEVILKDIFRQNADVAKISQSFLRPYAIAIPAGMLRLCSEQIMFSFGRTKPAMLMGLINAAIGMGLATILAFGKLGAPKLEEKGLLIGYILEAYLTAIAYSLYIALHPNFKHFAFFRPKAVMENIQKIKETLFISGPILLGNTIEMGGILATGALSGLCGVSAQAAFSTTMQFTLFTFLLQSAFGQSSCQEMSRLIGEQSYLKASNMGKYSIPTTLAYVAPLPILFSIEPRWLVSLLGQDNDTNYNVIRLLVPMMALAVIIDAVRYNLLQQLRNNLGDGKPATLISSISLLSGVFLSLILATQTNMGVYGVALGYITGCFTASIGLSLRWRTRITPQAIESHTESIVTPSPNMFFSSPRRQGLETDLLIRASEQSKGTLNI